MPACLFVLVSFNGRTPQSGKVRPTAPEPKARVLRVTQNNRATPTSESIRGPAVPVTSQIKVTLRRGSTPLVDAYRRSGLYQRKPQARRDAARLGLRQLSLSDGGSVGQLPFALKWWSRNRSDISAIRHAVKKEHIWLQSHSRGAF